MKIILIRHGESEGNANPLLYLKKEDKNIELTEKGKIQAGEITLNEHSFYIYSSPYKRALDTAKIYCDKIKYNNIIQNPLLIERGWGELRNKVYSRLHSEKDFKFFIRPENGESFFDLYQRVLLFINYLKLNHGSDDHVIIFTHGEWIKIFDMIAKNKTVEEFDNTSKGFKVKNCEVLSYYI